MRMRYFNAVYLFHAAFLIVTVAASPEIAFPFNSQVPMVARVSDPYEFQIAATSFARDGDANLSYSLIDAPAWLNIDSQSGTLYGIPGQGDSGVNIFAITATDAVGFQSMPCTLMVSTNGTPRVSGNASAVLATSGILSDPDTLTLHQNNTFAITFGTDFFQVGSGRIKAYYATLSDHTPLPSWLAFEASSLSFRGIAPKPVGEPQSWTINLIASDVIGFAGAVATFKLKVSTNTLLFTPQSEDVNATAGLPFSFKSLLDDLSSNGQPVHRDQIQSVTVQSPSWLSLQNDTLYLDGTPPKGFQTQNVRISVTDVHRDTANKTILIRNQSGSIFSEEVGNLTAMAGTLFIYTFQQSLFSENDTDITLDLGTASSWLHYNADSKQLNGTPPATMRSQVVAVNITATSRALSKTECQSFRIQVQAAPLGGLPTTVSSSTTASSLPIVASTSSATPLGASMQDESSRQHSVTVGAIAGLVIGCLAFLAVIAIVVTMLCRHKRRSSDDMGKPKISNPLLPSGAPPLALPEGVDERRDLEKGTITREQPPQIDLPLHPISLGTPQPRYSRSLLSSIGDGEAAIHADPNIPVWGGKSDTTHHPHDSYSAATELARQNSQASHIRLSQFGLRSLKKQSSKPLQSQRNSLRHSLNNSVIRLSKRKSRALSEMSVTQNRGSGTSISTHGTSMLSARISDFPEPPGSAHRKTLSIPMLSIRKVSNRRSIRLVSRSDSTATDDRPLAEKRQSFIRNRASSSMVSPLFASSRRSSNVRGEEGGLSGNHESLDRGRSQGTIFSASSSLEPHPPARNPRRLAMSNGSFIASLPRPDSALPSHLSSPGRAIPEDSDQYTTTTNSSAINLRDAQWAAEFAAQLALPRKNRSWVVPGEASPTPPPSSAVRGRDAARRKWAHRLKRDSRGNPISESPEESPVRLTDVAQSMKRLKNQGGSESRGREVEVKKGDRLSLLVSKDSINGPLRKRAQRDAAEESEGNEAQATTGAHGNESEWEDMMSNRTSDGDSNWGVHDTGDNGMRSSFSGKAFI